MRAIEQPPWMDGPVVLDTRKHLGYATLATILRYDFTSLYLEWVMVERTVPDVILSTLTPGLVPALVLLSRMK